MEAKIKAMENEIKEIKTKKFALRLDKELFTKLEERSQEECRSLNQEICYILGQYLV